MDGTITAIPGSIVKAICRVQATLEAVAKSQFNKHGGYKFASADDIYAAVTRKLGEAGVVIFPLQMAQPSYDGTKVDVLDREGNKTGEKTQTTITFQFGYMLASEDATWFDPRSARSIRVLHTGPQTFNAAESYCQKQFLRGLFKLPTGDMDLDGLPQADTEEDQLALNGNGAKRKSSRAAKKDGTDALFNEINRHIQGAGDAEGLRFVRQTYADEWSKMPARWVDLLDQAYHDQMASFGVTEAAE